MYYYYLWRIVFIVRISCSSSSTVCFICCLFVYSLVLTQDICSHVITLLSCFLQRYIHGDNKNAAVPEYTFSVWFRSIFIFLCKKKKGNLGATGKIKMQLFTADKKRKEKTRLTTVVHRSIIQPETSFLPIGASVSVWTVGVLGFLFLFGRGNLFHYFSPHYRYLLMAKCERNDYYFFLNIYLKSSI